MTHLETRAFRREEIAKAFRDREDHWIAHKVKTNEIKTKARDFINPSVKIVCTKRSNEDGSYKWEVTGFGICGAGGRRLNGATKYGFRLLTQRGRAKTYKTLDAVLNDWRNLTGAYEISISVGWPHTP